MAWQVPVVVIEVGEQSALRAFRQPAPLETRHRLGQVGKSREGAVEPFAAYFALILNLGSTTATALVPTFANNFPTPPTDLPPVHDNNPSHYTGVPLNLGNQVWYDVNNNGQLDAGEFGVNGVAVELLNPETASAPCSTPTLTSSRYPGRSTPHRPSA